MIEVYYVNVGLRLKKASPNDFKFKVNGIEKFRKGILVFVLQENGDLNGPFITKISLDINEVKNLLDDGTAYVVAESDNFDSEIKVQLKKAVGDDFKVISGKVESFKKGVVFFKKDTNDQFYGPFVTGELFDVMDVKQLLDNDDGYVLIEKIFN